MAMKCLHNHHSFPDQQHKFQQIENEQAQGSTDFEGKVTPQETFDLLYLKYDWFCKGDQGEIMTVHLYVKDLTSHKLDVILYEDELQVKFCTSNNEFLKMYSGTSANTLFSWTLLLRGNADIQESSCRISKLFLEISLKKKTPGRWSGLEKLNFPGQKGNGVPKDRPFRNLSGGSRLGMMSHSKQTVCNGVHEKFENSQNLASVHDKEIKVTSKANNAEETHPIPEEKIITNGDPVQAQAPESNEYSECTNTERNSFDGHRPDEREVKMAEEELRTLKTNGSTNGHLNRENAAEKAPVENDWVDMSSVSQAQKASGTSTAESLTTSFSSLSTTVQPTLDPNFSFKTGTPSSDDVLLIASELGSSWKMVGRALKVPDGVLEQIEEDERELFEKCYRVLKTWKEMFASDATYQCLSRALQHPLVKRANLAVKCCGVRSCKNAVEAKDV